MALRLLLDDFDPFVSQWGEPFHHFGLGLTPDDLRHLTNSHRYVMPGGYRRNWQLQPRRDKGAGDIAIPSTGPDGFQVCMDVQQFKPNEISVKTVDNAVLIEAKHEERPDEHGYISRQFVRKYTLPKDYDPNQVVSTLSSDGVLTIKAPPPPAIEDNSKERIVYIQQTGPAMLNVKDNKTQKQDENAQSKL